MFNLKASYSGDSYEHKLCSFHSGFIFYRYEMDCMSNLYKSKQYDLIDMFYDTSRYLDDIFIIENPEFEKQFPDIYSTELQLNKANTSNTETFFLDSNIM